MQLQSSQVKLSCECNTHCRHLEMTLSPPSDIPLHAWLPGRASMMYARVISCHHQSRGKLDAWLATWDTSKGLDTSSMVAYELP